MHQKHMTIVVSTEALFPSANVKVCEIETRLGRRGIVLIRSATWSFYYVIFSTCFIVSYNTVGNQELTLSPNSPVPSFFLIFNC